MSYFKKKLFVWSFNIRSLQYSTYYAHDKHNLLVPYESSDFPL